MTPDQAAFALVEHLYAIADAEVIPEDGEPEVSFKMPEGCKIDVSASEIAEASPATGTPSAK
ncbi:hypothetical protein [Streptomyces sp. NPDC058371]|uniref:hypothetical protein n=1 Tax=Streptomyces sp. NPDC058371 TaxID=3346463 RepID=UPI003665E1D2